MELIEANPLPIPCWRCVGQGIEDCDECDFMAARWQPSPADQIRLAQLFAEQKRRLEAKQKYAQARLQRRKNDTA